MQLSEILNKNPTHFFHHPISASDLFGLAKSASPDSFPPKRCHQVDGSVNFDEREPHIQKVNLRTVQITEVPRA